MSPVMHYLRRIGCAYDSDIRLLLGGFECMIVLPCICDVFANPVTTAPQLSYIFPTCNW